MSRRKSHRVLTLLLLLLVVCVGKDDREGMEWNGMVLRWIQLNECYGRGVWRGMGVTEAISDDEDGRGILN